MHGREALFFACFSISLCACPEALFTCEEYSADFLQTYINDALWECGLWMEKTYQILGSKGRRGITRDSRKSRNRDFRQMP